LRLLVRNFYRDFVNRSRMVNCNSIINDNFVPLSVRPVTGQCVNTPSVFISIDINGVDGCDNIESSQEEESFADKTLPQTARCLLKASGIRES